MYFVVLGNDEVRYRFLNNLLGHQVDRDEIKKKDITVSSLSLKSEESSLKTKEEYFSDKLPLFTELKFLSWENNKRFKYEDIRNCGKNFIFLIGYPYSTQNYIREIKNNLDYIRLYNFTVVLYVENFKSLDSDISDEEEGIENAKEEFEKYNVNVKTYGLGDTYDFLLWESKDLSKIQIGFYRKKLKELSEKMDSNVKIAYEDFLERKFRDEYLTPEKLETFVRFNELMLNRKKIVNVIYEVTTEYITQQYYREFFVAVEQIYRDTVQEICTWNLEKDLDCLRRKIIERFKDTITVSDFDITEEIKSREEYVFLINKKYSQKIIEFKKNIIGFFDTGLLELLFEYIRNRFDKLEEILLRRELIELFVGYIKNYISNSY